MKKNHVIFMTILVGVNAMMSCTPKYTTSFGPSQRFYEDDAKSKITTTASAVNPVEMVDLHEGIEVPPADEVVSQEKEIKTLKPGQNLTASVRDLQMQTGDVADEKVKEILGKYESKKSFLESDKLKDLAPKEKKELIKEVRRDIKEIKKAKKKSAIENKKIYAGIIIALAGLLVALLVSGAIGGVGILVGIVLIAWGLIEEGEL